MDWLKEILTKAGVEEDKVTTIIENAKKEVPNHYALKTDFNNKVAEIKTLTTEKSVLSEQLEDLKKVDPTNLQEEITKLQNANKELEDTNKKEIANIKRMSAIDLAIANSKTIDSVGLKAHLDLDKLSYDEEKRTLIGFDEQLKTIKDTCKYLFEEAPESNGQGHGELPGKDELKDIDLSSALQEKFK